MTDLADRVDAYESGQLGEAGILNLFGELIHTDAVWTMPDLYGQAATDLIENGYLTPAGELTERPRELVREVAR
jgi:hypothetical protein